MLTASFFTYRGPGRISIARFAPRDTPPGYKVFKPLAPGKWFNSVSYDEYRALYFAQLDKLDMHAVWVTLHKLADGHEPVVLCWETLKKPGEWCHRQMLSEYIKAKLGHDVPEYEVVKKQKPETLPLF